MPDYSSLRRRLVAYWTTDNATPPYIQWDASGHGHVATTTSGVPTLVDSPLGKGIRFISNSVYVYRVANHADLSAHLGWTISLWFKLNSFPGVTAIIEKAEIDDDWQIFVKASGELTFTSNFSFADGHIIPSLGEWHHFLARISPDYVMSTYLDGVLDSQIHMGGGVLPNASRVEFALNPSPNRDVSVSHVGIWTRHLTDAEAGWLYNFGSGLPFNQFKIVAEPSCDREQPCCQTDPFQYAMADASASGVADGADCVTVPHITFTPPSGSLSVFPTHCIISSDDPNATIRYTTDGSEPNESSSLYVNPVPVLGPTTVVKAFAYTEDCAGPVDSCQYRLETDHDFFWRFRCPYTVDYAGRWSVFAPNGEDDFNWLLDFTVPVVPLDIDKFIIYETNAAGGWNTGQAWSTQQLNNTQPWGPASFNTYPLVCFEPRHPDAGATQLNNAYSTDFTGDFGAFAAGDHAIEFFGEIEVSLSQYYFRCEIHLSDGTVVHQVISALDCDPPPPPPCRNPDPPAAVPHCDTVDLTWTPYGAGIGFELRRRLCGEGGLGVIIETDGSLGAKTDSVAPGMCYEYWIRVQCGTSGPGPEAILGEGGEEILGEGGELLIPEGEGVPDPSVWWESTHTPVTTSELPTITVTLEESTIGPGDSFEFEIWPENATTEAPCLNDGAVPPNPIIRVSRATLPTPPNPHIPIADIPIVGDPPFTFSDLPPGVGGYDYYFLVCNGCGDASVHVQGEVEDVPACVCDGTPASLQIQDWATVQAALKDNHTLDCTLLQTASCWWPPAIGTVQWDGSFYWSAGCVWRPAEATSFKLWDIVPEEVCVDGLDRSKMPMFCRIYCIAASWHLEIQARHTLGADDNSKMIWHGVKAHGESPVGIYTFSDGCVGAGGQIDITII